MSSLAGRQRNNLPVGAGLSEGARGAVAPASSGQPLMSGATIVVVAAIALTIIGMLYLIQTSHVAGLGYEMSRLQEQRHDLALEISELKHELARYESLHTVEQVADQRLGMTPMTNYEFIAVQQPVETELTVPQERPAKPAPLGERILSALLGVGSADSAPSQAGMEQGAR